MVILNQHLQENPQSKPRFENDQQILSVESKEIKMKGGGGVNSC